MARLIDADALYEEIERIYDEHYSNSSYKFIHDFFGAILRRVKKGPTVDAVPVVRGRWISNMGAALCSACHEECYAMSAMEYDYCPNCGAKMDLEVE